MFTKKWGSLINEFVIWKPEIKKRKRIPDTNSPVGSQLVSKYATWGQRLMVTQL